LPSPLNLEETLVVPPPQVDSSRTNLPRGVVEIVADAGLGMEHETQALLRVRLRAATLVLFAGIGVYFIRDLFITDAPAFVFRGITVIILAAATGILSSKLVFSLARLRQVEIGLFTLTSLYLAAYQYQLVLSKATVGNATFQLAAVKSCVLYFFAVMLLYGTFIPNTWQRAARILVPISLVPFVVTALLRQRSIAVDSLAYEIATFEQISDHVIMMVLGLASSLYGTHIINTLRNEAFAARQMGQYHLKERIGSGGMGEVYLAEHCLLKRPCAIKLIRPGRQTDPQALLRFEREVRTTAKLTHWNTVDIYDYGRTEDGTFYYVMELLQGMSLFDLVRRHGPLLAGRVIHLLRQTCCALSEAHAAGLIHRDIKPANIFAARIGGVCDVAKLLDFGLVKQTTDDRNASLPQDRALSGSPLYMAPEQGLFNRTDARSDIYSLGATAYFLLTGKVPFEGSNAMEVMLAHAREPVVAPSRVRPDVPSDLEQVVLRCLAKNPDERYPDVESLERALAACSHSGSWGDREAAIWWHEAGLDPPQTTISLRKTETPLSAGNSTVI
jgi:eukaryotic-like serine/threonine-protein kinase